MMPGLYSTLEELLALKHHLPQLKRASKAMITPGSHVTAKRGRGMMFAETRHYQPGDEIRHMEWRVTARTGRPHTKVFEEEKERTVILCLDFNPSLYFGTKVALKSVIAARLAALITWACLEQNDKVGAVFASSTKCTRLPAKKPKAAALVLLHQLCRYTQMPAVSSSITLSELLTQATPLIKPGSLLVFISDFYHLTAACKKQLQGLKHHHDIQAYHIYDALEMHPPCAGRYAISDGQQDFLLDTTNSHVNDAYHAWCLQKLQLLKTFWRDLNIPLQHIATTDDLTKCLQSSFFKGRYGG